MNLFYVGALMLCTSFALAFPQADPDSLNPWKHSVVGAWTFTQVSYSDCGCKAVKMHWHTR